MAVLSSLMDDLVLSPIEDVSCELTQRVIAMFDQPMTPSSPGQDQECLFNFGSGKAASNKTKEFLLNVASIGKEIRINLLKNVLRIPIGLKTKLLEEPRWIHLLLKEPNGL